MLCREVVVRIGDKHNAIINDLLWWILWVMVTYCLPLQQWVLGYGYHYYEGSITNWKVWRENTIKMLTLSLPHPMRDLLVMKIFEEASNNSSQPIVDPFPFDCLGVIYNSLSLSHTHTHKRLCLDSISSSTTFFRLVHSLNKRGK